jgi:hypothetical protein
VEFRILGPLELLEDGHQVVRHRTRALRARPARLARFIEEQRAPPGSTTFAPVDPPPTWGNSVIGSGEIRPIVPTRGRLLLLGKGAVLAHASIVHSLLSRTRSRRAYWRQPGFRNEAPDGHERSCVHGPCESYADLSSSAPALGRRSREPLGMGTLCE